MRILCVQQINQKYNVMNHFLIVVGVVGVKTIEAPSQSFLSGLIKIIRNQFSSTFYDARQQLFL